MIIYYGSYSTTDGKECLMGHEEKDPNTGNVIIEQINGKNENEQGLYILKEEGKRLLREYKSIIKNKLEGPINLKELYYEQFED